MAEILEAFTHPKSTSIYVTGHPFDEWADGRVRRLTRGADFECSPLSMQRQLRRYAAANGVAVSIRRAERSLEVQFRLR